MAGISVTPAIGIDLGTAYSSAAVWWPDEVQMLPNNLGNNITPSYVAFDGNECEIGDSAVDVAALKPTNTVFDSKRLIGRRFSDPLIQSDLKRWPFKVIRGANDKPMIVVTYKDKEKQFAAEQIYSILLTKMKSSAEAFLGFSIKNAVITVPAYFNGAQRQATKNAGIIAGFNVLRITAEPTAAAIAYSFRKSSSSYVKNVLIFDLGGGTFDVSLVTVVKGTFAVKAISGDTHLGGVDFDNRMVDHCAEEFKSKHRKDLIDPRALRRLRTACEKAKKVLSDSRSTTIIIDSLDDGIDFEYQLTREKFEELNMDLFKKCIDHVETCLKDAELDKRSIHDVVLVGGSTRIPKVQQLLQEFFNGKKLSKGIHPDEAVARGAAIQAANLNGQHNQEIREVVWTDVTPLSLGVAMSEDNICVVVPRNTTIPTKKEILLTTTEDDQTQIVFPVYQGERPTASGNILFGEFVVSGVSPAPRGAARIKVCFEVDTNGIFTVSAEDGTTGETSSITISGVKGGLSKNEIERMLEEAKKFELDDEEQQMKSLAESELEICIYGVRSIGMNKKRAGKSQLAYRRRIKKVRSYFPSSGWMSTKL